VSDSTREQPTPYATAWLCSWCSAFHHCPADKLAEGIAELGWVPAEYRETVDWDVKASAGSAAGVNMNNRAMQLRKVRHAVAAMAACIACVQRIDARFVAAPTLMQACVHPFWIAEPLLPPHMPTDHRIVESCGKMLVLDRMLTHLRAMGHKVLIFSQFTTVSGCSGLGAGGSRAALNHAAHMACFWCCCRCWTRCATTGSGARLPLAWPGRARLTAARCTQVRACVGLLCNSTHAITLATRQFWAWPIHLQAWKRACHLARIRARHWRRRATPHTRTWRGRRKMA